MCNLEVTLEELYIINLFLYTASLDKRSLGVKEIKNILEKIEKIEKENIKMRCNGLVIYKGIEKREGGKFKDAQGREINYDSSYVVKFDEDRDGNINQRKIKFPVTNTGLYDKIKGLEVYSKIDIVCDVVLSDNACRLVLVDVIKK